jgi:hypothetical protein
MDISLDLEKLDNYTPPPLPKVINGTTFNDRAKSVTASLVGAIPKAGSTLKFMVGLFWPSSEDDLWEKIQDNVERAIDAKLTTYNIDKAFGLLEMIQEDISKTFDSKQEKVSVTHLKRYSVTIESNFSALRKQYFSKNYGEHLLNLMIVAAHLELAYLRLVIDLFDEDKSVVNKYTEIIEKTHKEYISLFSTNFKKWRSFRKSQIDIQMKRETPHAQYRLCTTTVTDKLDEANSNSPVLARKASFESNHNDSYAISAASRYQECLYNQSVGKLIEEISSAAFLNRYLPGEEEAPPVFPKDFQHRYLGPYLPTNIKSNSYLRGEVGPKKNEKPGRIIKIEFINDLWFKTFHKKGSKEWEKEHALFQGFSAPPLKGREANITKVKSPINHAKLLFSKKEYEYDLKEIKLLHTPEEGSTDPKYINATLGHNYEITAIMTSQTKVGYKKSFHSIKFRFDYSLGFQD